MIHCNIWIKSMLLCKMYGIVHEHHVSDSWAVINYTKRRGFFFVFICSGALCPKIAIKASNANCYLLLGKHKPNFQASYTDFQSKKHKSTQSRCFWKEETPLASTFLPLTCLDFSLPSLFGSKRVCAWYTTLAIQQRNGIMFLKTSLHLFILYCRNSPGSHRNWE